MRPLVVTNHRAATAARTVPGRRTHVRGQRLIRCNVFTPTKVINSQTPQISSPSDTPKHPAQHLLQWAVSSGGVAHPLLRLTDDAPCGCRGVVAASDITLSSCCDMWAQYSKRPSSVPPLVAVPEQLCMSSEDALELLSRVVASADPTAIITKCHSSSSSTASHTISTASNSISNTPNSQGWGVLQHAVGSFGQLLGLQAGNQQAMLQQRLGQLQPPMLLALLLAHQRRLSEQSSWHPYISSLPEQPPCAWFEVVEQQLLGHSTYKPSESSQAQQQQEQAVDAATLASAASAVAAKCAAAADVFGAALGGISAAEIAWAYGQVVSRAFATGPPGTPGIALLPVIDMLNHSAGAAVPVCWLGDEEEEVEQQRSGNSSAVAADAGEGYWCVGHRQMSAWAADEGAGADSVTHSSSADSSASSSSDSLSESVRLSDGTEDQVLLRQGEELYISYMSSCDAAAAFLSFGFVPPELQ